MGAVQPTAGTAEPVAGPNAAGERVESASPSIPSVPGENVRLGPRSVEAPPSIGMTQAIAGAAMVVGVLLVAYAARRKVLARKSSNSVNAEPGVDTLAQDMQDLSERLAAELDRKADRLEQLIEAADERLRRLDAAEKAPVRAAVVTEVKPTAKPGTAAPSLEVAHREVYELADGGLTPLEIAKRLERPTGQIELILNLRGRSAAF